MKTPKTHRLNVLETKLMHALQLMIRNQRIVLVLEKK